MKRAVLLMMIIFLFAACGPNPTRQESTAQSLPIEPEPTEPPASVTPIPPTATSQPTAEPAPDIQLFENPNFIFQGDDPTEPLISHRPTAEIDNRYINPGAVIYHDGLFHMFFNSFTGWPGVIEVGYLTSADGFNWQPVQDAPVFTTDQIPFGNGFADVSSAVVLEDGTWLFYFHTIQDRQIGLATANSPTGSWQVLPDPLLTGEPEGSWDEGGLSWPNVVFDGTRYRMYYGGQSGTDSAIGLATSPDGFNWTKYNDPATSEQPFAESDPVFTAQQDWDLGSVDRPRIQRGPDGWHMIYAGDVVERRGLAFSDDGISWQPYIENPIFTSDIFPTPGYKTWDTALLYHEGAYYYFMELGTLSGTNLYLAVHDGI